jgi:hypothetical protein
VKQSLSCPNCGSQITTDQQFCGICGAKLTAATIETAGSCSSCGAFLNPGQTICTDCETKLYGVKPALAATPQQVVADIPVIVPDSTSQMIDQTAKKANINVATRIRKYGTLNLAAIIFQIIGWIVLVLGSLASIVMIIFVLMGGGFQLMIPEGASIVGTGAIILAIICLFASLLYGLIFLAFAELFYTVVEIARNTIAEYLS